MKNFDFRFLFCVSVAMLSNAVMSALAGLWFLWSDTLLFVVFTAFTLFELAVLLIVCAFNKKLRNRYNLIALAVLAVIWLASLCQMVRLELIYTGGLPGTDKYVSFIFPCVFKMETVIDNELTQATHYDYSVNLELLASLALLITSSVFFIRNKKT